MNDSTQPEFEDLLDRLDFATLAELISTAAALGTASETTADRGTRAILLTLQDLFETRARARERDLDTELWDIIDNT